MFALTTLLAGLMTAQTAAAPSPADQQPQMITVIQNGVPVQMMLVPVPAQPVLQQAPVVQTQPVMPQAPAQYPPPSYQPASPMKPVPTRHPDEYYRYNVGTNTLGYVIGLFSISFGAAVHRNLAIRTEYNIYKNYFGDGWGVGGSLGLPIFINKAWKGFFLQPGGKVFYIHTDGIDIVAGGPESLLGFQWELRNGITLALAGGLQFVFISNNSPSNEDLGLFRKGVLPAGYFQIGKSF